MSAFCQRDLRRAFGAPLAARWNSRTRTRRRPGPTGGSINHAERLDGVDRCTRRGANVGLGVGGGLGIKARYLMLVHHALQFFGVKTPRTLGIARKCAALSLSARLAVITNDTGRSAR